MVCHDPARCIDPSFANLPDPAIRRRWSAIKLHACVAPCAHTSRDRLLPVRGRPRHAGRGSRRRRMRPPRPCGRETKAEAVDRLFQQRRLGPAHRSRSDSTTAARTRRRRAGRSRRRNGSGPTVRPRSAFSTSIAGGMPEGVIDRLQPIDIEHDQRTARMIALDVGDRAMEFALESRGGSECRAGNRCPPTPPVRRSAPAPAPVAPAAGESPVWRHRARPSADGAGAAVALRGAGCVWRAPLLRPASRPFPAFCSPTWRSPPWFSSSWPCCKRLAGIHQDRIVHSGPLATPCRTSGPIL